MDILLSHFRLDRLLEEILSCAMERFRFDAGTLYLLEDCQAPAPQGLTAFS